MNKKGFGGIMGIIFGGLFLSAFVAAMLTRPQHVEKRYLEKCVNDGYTIEACKVQIAPLSLEERIDYIRDKATEPTTYNFTHR